MPGRRSRASTSRGTAASDWEALARFPRRRSWWWLQPAERPFRPTYVSALAVVPGAIVAGIEACGVLRSLDGGGSWNGHRRRALRDCHALAAGPHRILEAGSGGLALTVDGGASWERRKDGLDRRYGWDVARDGQTTYLVAAPCRSAHTGDARARIFRAEGDGRWEPCTGELPSLPRLACSAAGEVFAALGDGSLLRSPDRGAAWEPFGVDLGGWSRALLSVP